MSPMSRASSSPKSAQDEKLFLPDDMALDELALEEEEPAVEELEDLDQLETLLESEEPAADPVRAYLRDIGQVALLEPHQEMWLSTVREAATFLADARERARKRLRRPPTHRDVWEQLVRDGLAIWDHIVQSCRNGGISPPDFSAIVQEARALHHQSLPPIRSYTYEFLEATDASVKNGQGGDLTRLMMELLIYLLLLPEATLDLLRDHWVREGRLPSARRMRRFAPPEEALARAWADVDGRAAEAQQNLIQANLRLVVSIAKSSSVGASPFWTSSRRATWASCGPSASLTTPKASSSPPTPPGGSARPSAARLPTSPAPSASPSTWWRR
jgi:hypothetical protein